MSSDQLGLVGQSLGEYRVQKFRGNGAFADVYCAQHRPTGEAVALKILRPSADWHAHREFDNEGELLLKTASSSRIIDIFDTDSETVPVTLPAGGTMPVPVRYHVLELADGCLSELIAKLSELDWSTRLSLFRDVVLGVHQLHGRQLVHRDLKSSNVLVFESRGVVTAKLNDLGRSRDLTRPASVSRVDYEFGRGDPDFAAPEFLWGAGAETELAHRSCDLYGLGSVLFELCLGHGPTALAVFPHAAIVLDHRSLSSDERSSSYRARVAEVRSWYRPVFEMFDAGVPPAIRPQAGRLVRQLCDPDPALRLPRVALGRRGSRPNELSWLLNRVDSLRLTLRNAEKQAADHRARKTALK